MKKAIGLTLMILSPFLITGVYFLLCLVLFNGGKAYVSWAILILSSLVSLLLVGHIKALKWKCIFGIFIVPLYLYLTFWFFEILAMCFGQETM